jgi:hypothetical protein
MYLLNLADYSRLTQSEFDGALDLAQTGLLPVISEKVRPNHLQDDKGGADVSFLAIHRSTKH